jgi:hypothetical protein
VSSRRRRVVAALAGVAILVLGLAVHTLLPASPVTDIAGDALYAVLIVAGLVVCAPRMRSVAVGAMALVWCVAVELLQLTGLPVRWAQEVPPVALVLGTGFDARDIAVYATAIVVAVAIDALVRHRTRPR